MVENRTVLLKNDLAELNKLSVNLEEFFDANNIPPNVLFHVNLALDEIVTNIISYGYSDSLSHEIAIDIVFSNNLLCFIISDDGVPFNPLDIPEPDIKQSVEEREIGGLGFHFVRKIMDSIEYQRVKGQNVLTLKKAVGI